MTRERRTENKELPADEVGSSFLYLEMLMARDFARAFYNSAKWRKCRESFIKERIAIDGGMCQTCGQVPGYIVHHTIWLTPDNINDPDVALNHELLKYDCLECHNREIEGEGGPRYRFGPDGDVLPPLKPLGE